MSNYSEGRRGGFGEDNVVTDLGDWTVHRTEKGECGPS